MFIWVNSDIQSQIYHPNVNSFTYLKKQQLSLNLKFLISSSDGTLTSPRGKEYLLLQVIAFTAEIDI